MEIKRNIELVNHEGQNADDILVRQEKVSSIKAFASGSASSACTTILFQPLELIKTRLQTRSDNHANKIATNSSKPVIGRTTRSAIHLISQYNIIYLWRGTSASLIRSVPGVGLYYASLNILNNLHDPNLRISDQMNNKFQTFSSGFLARSFVSFVLLPVTVIKVRYESGAYQYKSIIGAIKNSYLKSGWVGLYPTILRDSLFSGLYYMIYTSLKRKYIGQYSKADLIKPRENFLIIHFVSGVIAGSIASLITNPADVIKTNMQVNPTKYTTMIRSAKSIYVERCGLIGFFDGLGPRMLRRTMVAAFTWSMYEYMIDLFK